MSATLIAPATARLQRSQLAVPASNTALFEKAARSQADVIFLDCEDAVAPSEKAAARRNVIAALNEIDWGAKTMQVRINGLDTEYMYRDVIDIVEGCPRLDMLVSQIELARPRARRIGFDVLIETALGLANVDQIAQSSRRIEALSFGVGDYAASVRARSTVIGGGHPDYGVLSEGEAGARVFHSADLWHYAQSRVLVACRAYGLRPIDGPFGDYSDAQGYATAARRAAALGYEGKWAIHPSQIALANDAFTPAEAELAQARKILAAMEQAQTEGRGAASLDGHLIDIASIKMAENTLRLARKLDGPQAAGGETSGRGGRK